MAALTFHRARAHRRELQAMQTVARVTGAWAPLVWVACPTCGMAFYTALGPATASREPPTIAHGRQAARRQLARECPDHHDRVLVSYAAARSSSSGAVRRMPDEGDAAAAGQLSLQLRQHE